MSFNQVLLVLCISGATAVAGEFSAGAARLEITPAKDASLPMSGYAQRTSGFTGIHDALHVRALWLSDEVTEAAILTCDLAVMPEKLWNSVTEGITAELGIPRENIMLAGTHTHGGPTLGPIVGDTNSRRAEYVQMLQSRITEALRLARSRRQPARIGYGAGNANVNTNRRARTVHGGWDLGVDPDGPSDKTVAVLKIETTAGRPLAVFINYSVHGVVMGYKNLEITADLPGATSRFVEEHFGDRVVALWTSGAAGDQNPIIGPNGTYFRQVADLGRILGEEVLRIAAGIRTIPRGRIRATQTVVTCPGRRPVPPADPTKGVKIEFTDSTPVSIRLSYLALNQIVLAGISGEVLTGIGTRLKRESPFTATIVVTHANGSSGYLPDDAAYNNVSYEIVSTRVKPGCAERAIVGGFLEMMDRN